LHYVSQVPIPGGFATLRSDIVRSTAIGHQIWYVRQQKTYFRHNILFFWIFLKPFALKTT